MPELPEVETIRTQLEPLLEGAVIVDAWAFPSAKFDSAPRAVGHRIDELQRRGKYLLLELSRRESRDQRELIVHLGMTGRLSVESQYDPSLLRPHLRARWSLEDGRTLLFDDIRRFGRIAVVDRGGYDALPTLAALGPEPFADDFTPEGLHAAVNRSSRPIKTQLLSQRVVAGVGNIYADEALWRAKVRPSARRLTKPAAARLHQAIRAVLAEAISNGGTTLRDYRDAKGGEGGHQPRLDCYGRSGLPCVRCGETLRRVVIDARSTTFCPKCQRR